MKKILLSIFAIAAIFQIQAADTLKFDAPIQKVQFFLEGAQIETTIDVQLPKGEFVLALKGLPISADPESIRLKADDEIKIHSLEPKINTNQLKPNAFESTNKKIESLNKKRIGILNQLKALSEEQHLLKSNYNIKGDQTLTKEQLNAVADFYGERMYLIQKKTTDLNEKLDEIKNEMSELHIQMKNKQNERKAFAEVYIFGETENIFSDKVTLTYFIPEAGWSPVYDLFVESTTKPIKLVHKAIVSQNTQEDWKNITFGISNANPVQTNIKPELSIWYTYNTKPNYDNSKRIFSKIGGTGALKGTVKDNDGNGVPFANIIVQQNGNQIAGTSTDFDGNYTIKPIVSGTCEVLIQSVGFQKKMINGVIINSDKTRFLDIVMHETNVKLDEIQVVEYKVPNISKDQTSTGGTVTAEEIYKIPSRSRESLAATVGGIYAEDRETKSIRGAREEGEVYYVDGIKTRKGKVLNIVRDGVALKKGNRIEYNFDKKYDIPTGEKGKYIEYKTTSIPAEFKYYAVPEFADESFLIAEITNWDEIKILEGNASVFFEETWVGSIPLSEKSTKDTMKLSIARDPAVVVKKETKDYEADHTMGGRLKKETYTYSISARNSKSETVLLTIEDQIPVSRSKEKEVEVIELSGAKHNEKKGFLTWEIELKPGETKKLTMKYSVER